MASSANRLIIALDYGTTFTGVAFHPVTGGNDEEINVDEISLIKEWGGEETSSKVPSIISFSPIHWGLDLLNFLRETSPGEGEGVGRDAGALVWTKLELEQQERPDELRMILEALIGMNDLDYSKIVGSAGLPQYPAKDPVDIVAEYLSKVREYLVQTILGDYSPEYLSTTPVDLVITVPTVWKDEAKDRIFHAIQKAGFTRRAFRMLQDIILVTEPEAAAVYSLRSLLQYEDEDFIGPGECFVMCDAGGGTVDLISYRVRQLSPTLELDEVTAGTGAKCGATFIDQRFRKWLAKKLGPKDFRILIGRLPGSNITSHTIIEPRMIRLMEVFEAMKRKFDGSSTHNFEISLRGLVDLEDDPARGIQDGHIHIS
ncbi:hypothetical protein GP486_006968 [Trichoglossum hirsutum]|uniref:Actin-like ATPase domain-containing protein n=1 Tax=Trichoglossum hirsutum TaxID=265104 RepID=A0A9P8IG86_9PEZI|nr:hypothetical protein GP486_006968 [Trichoglossum hirsutum]